MNITFPVDGKICHVGKETDLFKEVKSMGGWAQSD